MPGKPLSLQLLPEMLAVCRLEPDASVPDWAMQGSFSSITRTANEVSIVCAESGLPEGAKAERGWRALRVEGPLDFALTGVLARLAKPLAEMGISIFALSTYDTDYVLVRDRDVRSAVAALRAAGHHVVTTADS